MEKTKLSTDTLEIDDEDMNLNLHKEKQNTNSSESNTGFEADTAAGGKSQSNSQEEECNKELDRHHENKIEEATNLMAKLWNEKAPALVPCSWLVRISGIKLNLQKMRDIKRSASQATARTLFNTSAKRRKLSQISFHTWMSWQLIFKCTLKRGKWKGRSLVKEKTPPMREEAEKWRRLRSQVETR